MMEDTAMYSSTNKNTTLPKELLDGVETLVRCYGFHKFQEAVTAVSFSPSSGGDDDGSYWRKNYLLYSRDDQAIEIKNISTIELLSLNEQYLNAKGVGNVVLKIEGPLQDSETKEIITAITLSSFVRDLQVVTSADCLESAELLIVDDNVKQCSDRRVSFSDEQGCITPPSRYNASLAPSKALSRWDSGDGSPEACRRKLGPCLPRRPPRRLSEEAEEVTDHIINEQKLKRPRFPSLVSPS
jgi:hypothetical protein